MRTPFLCLFAGLSLAPSLPAAEKPADPLAAARQRLQRGNYAEARAAYEELAKADATRPQAAIGLAAAWRAEGEYAKALAALDDAIKAATGDPDLHAHRADLLYDLGRWDDALADAKAATAKADGHFLARWVRARVLRDRGDVDEAKKEVKWFVRVYTEASNDDKDITDPDALAIVGQAAAENARWSNLPKQFSFILEEVYADTVKKNPDFWQAENLAGRMLLDKYNKADAEDAFDAALKVNPKAADAVVGKGLVALQAYDLKEAEVHADRALEVNPKHPEALRLRAELDLIAGDFAAAVRRLAAARAINPRDEATLGRLAACFHLTKQPAAFDALVKEVEGFDTKPGAFYHALGETLDARKKWADAEGYLRKAADLRPETAAPRAALGMLQLRMGREKEARTFLDAAYSADPFNVRVFNSRKVLKHLDGYATLETAHYLLRYDPKADAVLAAFVGDFLEETHAGLKAQFNYEPAGKILVELFSTHEMFSGRTVALPDLHTIGASSGRVMTMASPQSKDINHAFHWGRVVRHELVHIFNLSQSDFQVPHWLTEGLAVRSEGETMPPDWMKTLRERRAGRTLLDLDTITLGFIRPKDRNELALAYCQARLYVDYMTKAHGEASVGKMLDAYRTGADTGDLLGRVLGVDKATFEAGYRKYVDDVATAAGGTHPPRAEPPMTRDALEAAHAKAPDDATVAARLAEKLLQVGKSAEAGKMADATLAKEKHHPLAATVKARLLVRDKDEAGAKALLAGALADNPDDHRLLLAVGKLHVAAKEWDKAAAVLERGRTAAPLDGNWLELLSQVYAETKRPAELMSVLADVAARDPDDLAVRLKLAKLHHDAKRFPESERWAREVLFIDVKHEEGRSLLLESLRARKKDAEADRLAKRFE